MLVGLPEEVGIVAVVFFPDFGKDIHFGVHHEALPAAGIEDVNEGGGGGVGRNEGQLAFIFQRFMDGFEESACMLHQSFAGSGRGDDEGHEVGVVGMLVDAVEHLEVGECEAGGGEGGEEEHVLLLGLFGDAHGTLEEGRELAFADVGA